MFEDRDQQRLGDDGEVLAIVAPGQGAQTVGFLSPWLELDTFSRRLERASEIVGLDLARLGTQGDEAAIRDTAVAQPLLVASALLTACELSQTEEQPFCGDIAAGHSVGEIAAAAGAGVFTLDDAMRLVGVRGRAMAEAAALRDTSMAAVVGGDADEVAASISAHGLTAANNNGAGQVVAAGTVEDLTDLIANPPKRSRVIQLSVAGAFHTEHMAPAVPALQACADELAPTDPRCLLLTNKDGSAVARGHDYLKLIVNQIVNPVRWDLCMDTMRDKGVTGLLELTPAGTLTGIARRNLKGIELFNLNTPDQCDEAAEFVARHAGHSPAESEGV